MAGYVERMTRVERPRSQAAVWCQRLAVFCLPYLLIVILGHRFGAVDTVSTFWLLGLAILMLLASLAAGCVGFYELWNHGYKGGISSARGMLLSAVLLLPFAYFAIQALLLPQIYDISTDLDDPPAYDSVLAERSEVMNPVADPTDPQKIKQLRAYPQLTARRYPLDTGQVFREVVTLIADRDWTIVTTESAPGQAAIDAEGSGLVAKPVTDANGRPLRIPKPRRRPVVGGALPGNADGSAAADFETVQVSPVGRDPAAILAESEERYVEAVATSLLFGFESDLVVRLIEEEEGTLVDMRSTSRWGAHDLGSNSKRIIQFMNDLDLSLQGLRR
ncbi:MAG: DUF1499 domain-containing protein [Rhizobiaceae bacterium]